VINSTAFGLFVAATQQTALTVGGNIGRQSSLKPLPVPGTVRCCNTSTSLDFHDTNPPKI